MNDLNGSVDANAFVKKNTTDFFDALPLELFEYIQLYNTIVFVGSILANSIFSILVFAVNEKTLKAYSRVLFLNSIVDMLASIVLYYAQTVILSRGSDIYRLLLGVPVDWPQSWRVSVMNTLQFFLITMNSTLMIVFIFRYSMIIRFTLLIFKILQMCSTL